MADADRFLHDALVQSACLSASAESVELKDLTSDVFVSIVWRCLAKIQEAEPHLEFQIPQDLDAQGGVAARHRVGSQLANIIKELGYAGDCGYNHFLYPNEKESRGILSWLVGKLPTVEEIKTSIGGTPAAANPSIASDYLADQPLSEVFSTWMKKKTWYRIPSRDVQVLRGFEKLPLRTKQTSLPWSEDDSAPLGGSLSSSLSGSSTTSQAVSVLEAIAVAQRLQTLNLDNLDDADDAMESSSDFGGRIEDDDVHGDADYSSNFNGEGESVDSSGVGSAGFISPFFVSAACAIKENAMAQLEAAAKMQDETNEEGTPVGAQSETGISQELAALNEDSEQVNLEHIHVRLMEAQQKIDQLRDEVAQDQDELLSIQNRVEETRLHGAALKKQLDMKRHLLGLLPQAEANVAKLEAICTKNELKLEELANEWAAHKRPLEAEEESLLSMKSTRNARCRQFVAEMKTFRSEMKEMATTIQEKMDALHVLDKTYASLPQNINRNSYTNRIMDIIKQVHKQKQEIGRIIEDIKSIQKQLNYTSEKLKRSEAVTEEKIFGEASKQVNSSKDPNNPYVECYRKFVQVRDLFEELILVVGDVGKKENAARDLENWITQLQGRDGSEQLDRVLADLHSARQENSALNEHIRALRLKQ